MKTSFSYIILCVFAGVLSACALTGKPRYHPERHPDASVPLAERVEVFYDELHRRNLMMQGNQDDIRGFFPDEPAFYNFLDSLLPSLTTRKFWDKAIHTHRVEAIDHSGSRYFATVALVLYDKPYFFVLQKRMRARQEWEEIDGTWYPGKVTVEPRTWYEKLIKLP